MLGKLPEETGAEERPPGSEVWSVLWVRGHSRFWFNSEVTLQNHCLGEVSMALLFKVGKNGKGARQGTPVTLKGGA